MKDAKSALASILAIFALVWSASKPATAAETCHFENGNFGPNTAIAVKGWVMSGMPCGLGFTGGVLDGMQISTQPEHGKAVIDKTRNAVIYQSAKGYKGPDSFVVWVTAPFHNVSAWVTYEFDVK